MQRELSPDWQRLGSWCKLWRANQPSESGGFATQVDTSSTLLKNFSFVYQNSLFGIMCDDLQRWKNLLSICFHYSFPWNMLSYCVNISKKRRRKWIFNRGAFKGFRWLLCLLAFVFRRDLGLAKAQTIWVPLKQVICYRKQKGLLWMYVSFFFFAFCLFWEAELM